MLNVEKELRLKVVLVAVETNRPLLCLKLGELVSKAETILPVQCVQSCP